jgi:hypothetical protein
MRQISFFTSDYTEMQEKKGDKSCYEKPGAIGTKGEGYYEKQECDVDWVAAKFIDAVYNSVALYGNPRFCDCDQGGSGAEACFRASSRRGWFSLF